MRILVLDLSLLLHCKEPIPEIRNKHSQKRNRRGHSPYFHLHVSKSDLYLPTIDLPNLQQEMFGPILEMYKSLADIECGNFD